MDTLGNKKLAIIGGGHIGLALAEGFVGSGKISVSRLIVTNPTLSKIAHLEKYGVEITSDNVFAARKADYIFLAVKPKVVKQVLSEIGSAIERKLIISLAAVVTIKYLRKHVKDAEIIRIMPNMAISCNQGIIGLFADGKSKKQITQLLSILGLVIEVDKEADLNTLTLLSGCGPAIVSQFMEFLTNYGIKLGLSSDRSYKLALQTFKGTAAYLESSGFSSHQLVQSVATKGGITETILTRLRRNGFQKNFIKAMNDGYGKIKELGKILNIEQEVIDNGND